MFDQNLPALTPSYHWTPPFSGAFIKHWPQTVSINRACAAVSMSRQAMFMADCNAAKNTSIQCQLPEKSAISEMPISSPPCAECDERASRGIALIELQEHP